MIAYLFFMVFVAVILALWEVQIEGKDGWAGKAPCWRVEKGLIVRIMGGRPLTGYHFFMTIFLITLVHIPIFFVSWSYQLEFLLIGFYIEMLVVEDFLWFVFNPAFGIRNFRKGKIWWHAKWWGPVPDFYWISTAISIALFFFGRTAI